MSWWDEGERSDGDDAFGSESWGNSLLIVGGCRSRLRVGDVEELGWNGRRWEWGGTGWSEGTKSSRKGSGSFSRLNEFRGVEGGERKRSCEGWVGGEVGPVRGLSTSGGGSDWSRGS